MGEPRSSVEVGSRARWVEETVRLYRRYEVEVVQACGLCPWASGVRKEGRLLEQVFLQDDLGSLDPSLDAIDALSEGEVDLALFLYPRVGLDRAAFERFVVRLRDADVARQPLGAVPFVLAVFHPDAAPDLAEPERLIPFLRRTPDPTIQLVRATVLDRARGVTPQGTQFVDPRILGNLDATFEPPLRERIASTNLATTLRLGVDAVTRRFEDIARDRDETHHALSRSAETAAEL